jgi:hypothetical protein
MLQKAMKIDSVSAAVSCLVSAIAEPTNEKDTDQYIAGNFSRV